MDEPTEYANLTELNAVCPLLLVDTCGINGDVGGEVTLQQFLDHVCNLSGNTSVIADLVDGHLIATHDDGNGNVSSIEETITVITINSNILSYIDENGDQTDLVLPTGGGGGSSSALTDIISGHKIAQHDNGLGGINDINESITTLTLAGSTLTYVREDGTQDVINLPGGGGGATSSMAQIVATGHLLATHSDGAGTDTDVFETITDLEISGTTLTYTREDGTQVNLVIPSTPGGSISGLTNLITGNRIATHNDGDGISVDVFESITTLAIIGDTLTYTKEDGTLNQIDLSGYAADTNSVATYASQVTGGHVIGNLDNGAGTIYGLQESLTSLALTGSTLIYTREGGANQNIDLSTLLGGTDTVTNVVAGHRIATHTAVNGIEVDIDETVTDLDFDDATSEISYTDESGVTSVFDLKDQRETIVVEEAQSSHSHDMTELVSYAGCEITVPRDGYYRVSGNIFLRTEPSGLVASIDHDCEFDARIQTNAFGSRQSQAQLAIKAHFWSRGVGYWEGPLTAGQQVRWSYRAAYDLAKAPGTEATYRGAWLRLTRVGGS